LLRKGGALKGRLEVGGAQKEVKMSKLRDIRRSREKLMAERKAETSFYRRRRVMMKIFLRKGVRVIVFSGHLKKMGT